MVLAVGERVWRIGVQRLGVGTPVGCVERGECRAVSEHEHICTTRQCRVRLSPPADDACIRVASAGRGLDLSLDREWAAPERQRRRLTLITHEAVLSSEDVLTERLEDEANGRDRIRWRWRWELCWEYQHRQQQHKPPVDRVIGGTSLRKGDGRRAR